MKNTGAGRVSGAPRVAIVGTRRPSTEMSVLCVKIARVPGKPLFVLPGDLARLREFYRQARGDSAREGETMTKGVASLRELLLGIAELGVEDAELEDGTVVRRLRLEPGRFPAACHGCVAAEVNGREVRFPVRLTCQGCGGCE